MRSVFISWLAVISCSFAYAQLDTPSVPNSVGFELPMENSSITVSIGEPAITTLSTPTLAVTQGYLQPIDRQPCLNAQFTYFPNPAKEFINIEVSGCDGEIQAVEIIDLWGRLLATVIPKDDNQVQLGDLSQGVYVFKVLLKGGVSGSFTAVKLTN